MKKLKLFQAPDISGANNELSKLLVMSDGLVAEQILIGQKLRENSVAKFEVVEGYLNQVNHALKKIGMKIVYEQYEEKIETDGPDDIAYHSYFKFMDGNRVIRSLKVNLYFVPEVKLEQLESFIRALKPVIQNKEFKIFLDEGILEHRRIKRATKI